MRLTNNNNNDNDNNDNKPYQVIYIIPNSGTGYPIINPNSSRLIFGCTSLLAKDFSARKSFKAQVFRLEQ